MVVRIHLCLNFQWASCQYWAWRQAATLQMGVQFSPRSPNFTMALWSKSSLASLSRRRRRSITCQSCQFQWLRGVEVSTSLFQGLDSGALPDGAAMWQCDNGNSGGFLILCPNGHCQFDSGLPHQFPHE